MPLFKVTPKITYNGEWKMSALGKVPVTVEEKNESRIHGMLSKTRTNALRVI